MSHKAASLVGVLLIVGVASAAAHQATQPRPGPGSGVVDVKGTVEIANAPTVHVGNVPGVRIENVPTVRVGGAGFLTVKERYLVRWPAGEPEMITIAELGENGWVRVVHERTRWVNTAAAWSIERAP